MMSESKATKESTEKLYFEDAFLQEFTARIIRRESREGLPVVILDKTAFYPESGGQPHDLGTMNEVKVIRVEEENDLIIHYLEDQIEGDEVRGRIDWQRRFDHMQQHTGQHILSQSFYELIKGETLSFHLGQEESTIEINLPAIKDETQQRVEELTNQVVFSDLEVKTYFLPEDKISSIPLRKPPKKSGLIRVVEVAGFDYSACGGTHCLRTGQVGLIKILKQEKIRGNLRFSFVCGFRALKEFENYRRFLQETAKIFSAEEAEVPSCAEKNQVELKSLKKTQRKLEEKLAVLEAKELLSESGEKIISGLFPDKSPGEIKFLALNLVHQAEVVAILAALAGEYFHLVVAASDKLKVDVRKVIPVLQAAAEFKGGGSPTLIELVSPKKDRPEELCQLVADFFRKKINPG